MKDHLEEQELNIDIDLDGLLRRLNYLVTAYPMLRENLVEIEKATSILDSKQLKKLIAFIKVDLRAKAYQDNHRARTYTSQPDTLFESKATPWIGDKESLHLYNKHFVIGLKHLSGEIEYRLDYDEKKSLHVNLYIFGHSFSISIKPESNTFEAKSTGENHKIDDLDEQAQMIKFKFWTKMTVAYHACSPAGINSQYTFPLCSALDISFEQLKKELADNAPSNYLADKIVNCFSKKTISSLIYTHKELRDYLVFRIIDKRTESICYYEANADQNSETLSDSSPAESPVKRKTSDPQQPIPSAVGPGAVMCFSKPKAQLTKVENPTMKATRK
ncbi:MAG: hypothetical protein ACHQAX_05755 [Gammaproteobacteria bacterium]